MAKYSGHALEIRGIKMAFDYPKALSAGCSMLHARWSRNNKMSIKSHQVEYSIRWSIRVAFWGPRCIANGLPVDLARLGSNTARYSLRALRHQGNHSSSPAASCEKWKY